MEMQKDAIYPCFASTLPDSNVCVRIVLYNFIRNGFASTDVHKQNKMDKMLHV